MPASAGLSCVNKFLKHQGWVIRLHRGIVAHLCHQMSRLLYNTDWSRWPASSQHWPSWV